MIKRLYEAVALFAFINLTLVGGVGAYMYFDGQLDSETIESVAEIIRGRSAETAVEEESAEVMRELKGSAETSAEKINEAIESEEMERLLAERAEVELQQQQQLIDRRMLRFQQDIEEFETRKTDLDKAHKLRLEKELSDQYVKTIETVESLAPKKALEVLMNMTEEDALKVFLKLDERKRKKIIESCKSAEQNKWRDDMVNRMLRQPMVAGATPSGIEGQP